jgi:hypothetical protein
MSIQMTLARRGEPEPMHFRLLYGICFSIFLIAAVIQRSLPWTWFARRDDAVLRPSVVEQARNAASICATYAFMV